MAKKKKSKVKAVAKPVHYGYKVEIDSCCTHSEQSDEEYGPWEESYSNSLQGHATKTEEYPDVASIHDVKPGTNVLIVWAEWSTGDSFGHADNRGTEVLGLFLDMESAKALADGLKKDGQSWRTGSKKQASDGYKVRTPDGQVFESGFAPWNGYFESLSDIHINTATVF